MTSIVRLYSNELEVSDGLWHWLDQSNVSLALAAEGQLWLLTRDASDEPTVLERSIPGATSLASVGNDLLVAGQWQLWRFVAMAGPHGGSYEGFDRTLRPEVGHTLGAFGINDLAMTSKGPLFATARFNCVAATDRRMSLRPVWVPPWITALDVNDACHVDGIAAVDGALRYISCAGTGSTPESWRASVTGGGVLVSTDGDIVAAGLTLPRSPRWVDGKVVLLDGGTGRVVAIDPQSGSLDELFSLPGEPRCLTITNGVAIVGWTSAANVHIENLPISSLADPGDQWRNAGVIAMELASGRVLGTAQFRGRDNSIRGVAILPEARRLTLSTPRSLAGQAAVVVGDPEPLP